MAHEWHEMGIWLGPTGNPRGLTITKLRPRFERMFGSLLETAAPSRAGKSTWLWSLTCEDRVDIIAAMFTPNLDDPEQVLAYLSSPIRAIRDALDHGVSLADSMFSDLSPLDPHLWAHIARYGACQHLGQLEPDGWERGRDLPNSGIEVVRGPLVLRTLKAQGSDPPHPGSNLARRLFWTQGRQMRLPLSLGGTLFPEGANYILDWTVDRERVISLALSKPVGIWRYRGTPKLEWRRPVRITDGEELRFVPADEDLSVEPAFDPGEFEVGGDVG